MKKHNPLMTLLLVLAVVPALLGADKGFSCSCGNAGEPRIDEAILAKGYSEDGTPIQPTETFRPGDTFFCVVKVQLRGASKAVVRVEWLLVDANESDTKIDSATLTLDVSRDAVFTAKSEKPWPRGFYRARVLLDEQAKLDLRFRVE